MAEEKVSTTRVLGSKETGASPVDSDSQSEHGSSVHEHIFKDEALARYWRAVYDSSEYENRHRFDPNYTWTEAEEKKLVRKVRPESSLPIIVVDMGED